MDLPSGLVPLIETTRGGTRDNLHFGAIVPQITGEAVEACAEEVRQAAERHFRRAEG